MLFDITHRTTYRYSKPVDLGPHLLRLRPRGDGGQRLLRFHVRLSPTPSVVTETTDACGNAAMWVRFDRPTDHFDIHVGMAVEVTRDNPFDYLPTETGAASLPALYGETDRRLLLPYLAQEAVAPSVADFADAIATESAGSTLRFVMDLAHAIKKQIAYTIREEGDAYAPERTLALASGSCRDQAMLYVAACRHAGLAARFVSGYVQGAGAGPHQTTFLHAWAEVYIPGGGWRGFDPTHAVATADHHLTIAAGPAPGDAAPVHGHFIGPGAAARMESHINIQAYPLLPTASPRSA